MVKLLDKAFEELAKLPETQQESMAQWILDELADEARWEQHFKGSLAQLAQLGKQALQDHRDGKTQELDVDTLE